MTIEELLRETATGPVWRDIMKGLPGEPYSELACGNTLCFTKADPAADGCESSADLPEFLDVPEVHRDIRARSERRLRRSLFDHVRAMAQRAFRSHEPR